MLPSGEHLQLLTIRPDGTRLLTGWSGSPAAGLRLRHRDSAAYPREEDLFARHAERVGNAPVGPHDRALLLGSERAATERLARIWFRQEMIDQALITLFLVVALGMVLALFLVGGGTVWPAYRFIVGIGCMIFANIGISHLVNRPENMRWLDWDPPLPADAQRATDISDVALAPLEAVESASPTPFAPFEKLKDIIRRQFWIGLGVTILLMVVLGLVLKIAT